ncbi:MAG: beta-lactamase family protein, partial [Clostridiales bacterium]|nr:beta-lactamase family protein [Clostridiales bacterium]
QYYGYENRQDKLPLTKDTHIRVSSISKMVTAIGAMQLVEAGLIDLDESLSTYFGFDFYNPFYPDIPVTLRQLLTHTSSISASTGAGKSQSDTSLEKIITHNIRNKKNFLHKKPGTTYKYSNYAYGVLGALIEKVSNQNFNTYMQENVFQPLEIDAAYHPLFLTDQDHVSTTYQQGQVYVTGKKYLDGYNSFENTVDPEHHYLIAFGKLWIRPADLAKLLVVLCGDGTYNGVALLSEETVLQMREDQQHKGSVQGESIYGLGVERVPSLLEDRLVYGHQGMSTGMIANAYFDPATSLCFVSVTNGSSQARNNTISLLARDLFPLAYDVLGLSLQTIARE